MPGLFRATPTSPPTPSVDSFESATLPVALSVVEIAIVAGALALLTFGSIVTYRALRPQRSTAIACDPGDSAAFAVDDSRFCPVVASAAAGGIGLIGPHAASAARAVLALLVTDHHASAPGSTILTTTAVMRELADAPVTTLSRVREHDTIGSLIAEASQQLATRLDQPGPHPPLIVMVEQSGIELESILHRGRQYGIGGIVVGAAFPHQFFVRADGQLELVAAVKCGVLSRDGLNNCLSTVAQTINGTDLSPTSPSEPHIGDTFPRPAASLTPQLDGHAPLTLRLLGNVDLLCHNKPVRLGRVKAWELLAMVGADPRGHDRDSLMETLVADTVHSKARPHLNSLVSHARRELRNITGEHTADFILRTASGLCLDSDWITTDVCTFDRHLAAADTTTDAEIRTDHLHRAVELYRGPFCAGLLSDTTWYEAIRTYYQHAAHRAAMSLADHRHKNGDLHAAVTALDRATVIDGGNRSAYERLVTVHRERGDGTAATRAQHQLDALDQDCPLIHPGVTLHCDGTFPQFGARPRDKRILRLPTDLE